MSRIDEILAEQAETQERLARTEDRATRIVMLGELNALNDALRFQISLERCLRAPLPGSVSVLEMPAIDRSVS